MVYPEGNYQEYEYERPKSPTEIIIGNIIKAVVCIFLIVLGFFLVIVVTATLNTQTAIDYATYTNDFAISNPTLSQTVYTANPHLSSIVVTKYNSSNLTWGGVPSTDWSFDSDTTALTITAGALAWDITQLRVNANTDYAEPPTESVFTTIAVALIILAIMGLFGIAYYRRNYR